MLYRRWYIQIALMLVSITRHCFGMALARQGILNFTTEEANSTEGFDDPVPWTDLLKNCSLLGANSNTSQSEYNTTSMPLHCFDDLPTNIAESPPFKLSQSFFYIFNGLAGWSVIANSLPIAAIIKFESLHKPVNILVANLAASDVITGVNFFFLQCARHVYEQAGISAQVALSRFFFTSVLLSALCSAYSLLSLTAERYWFIVHGISYAINVTSEKCKIMVLVVWLWSVILAMLPFFGWNCTEQDDHRCVFLLGSGYPESYIVLILVFVFISMAAIVFLNFGVFWCLWKHISAIAAQEAAVHAQPSTSRKSAITIVIITIVFIVGWLPFCLQVATDAACKEDCSNNNRPLIAFAILNSAINPIIYAFRLAEIRRGVKRLFVRPAAIVPSTQGGQ